jgi:hypothetical protein
LAQRRQMLIARGCIGRFSDEIGPSRQNIAGKHLLDVGTRARDQSRKIHPRAVFLEVARERDTHVVILNGVRGEIDERRQPRQLGFHNLCTGVLELCQGDFRQAFDFRGEIGEPIIADHAQPHSLEPGWLELLPIIGRHRIKQGQIRDVARMRSDLVEERRYRHTPASGVAPRGRTKTGNAAEGRGNADRAFGVLGLGRARCAATAAAVRRCAAGMRMRS